jgi:4-amino-4-deoxy-L-arabinose transferase-like glycosyltransferase
VAILLAAALLRLWGIHWGLPDETHLFSYHPDEHFSLATVFSLSFGGGWSPHYFNYGPMYMHLVAAVAVLADHLPLRDIDAIPELMPKLILDARLITVALGVLTVGLVYLIGRNVYGRTAGLLAAATLAVMPLHAIHGHFATVDVPATFFIVLSLYFASSIVPRARPDGEGRRDTARPFVPGRVYLLAGAAAGLAAATKYNAGLALLFPLVAHVVRHGPGAYTPLRWVGLADRRVALAVVGLLIAFVVACPYALLFPAEWWGSVDTFQGVAYEMHHMRVGEHPAVEATLPGPAFHLVGSLAYGLGWPTLIVSLVALAFALTRRRRRDWLLLIFLVVWYVVISLAKVRYMRYAIPLLPIFALLTGRMLSQVMDRAAQPRTIARRAGLIVLRAAAVAALGHALLYTWAYDDAMVALSVGPGGVRSDCLPNAGAERGDSVGLLWPPWFCHPPLEYVNGGHVIRGQRVWYDFDPKRYVSPYEVRILGYDPPEDPPKFLVTTAFEVRDHVRADTEAWRNLSRTLTTHYTLDLQGQYDPATQLGKLPGADIRNAPMDWLYPFPGILVYRLRSDESADPDEPTEGSHAPGGELIPPDS